MTYFSHAELQQYVAVYIKVINNSFLLKYLVVELGEGIIRIYECFTAHNKRLSGIKKSQSQELREHLHCHSDDVGEM